MQSFFAAAKRVFLILALLSVYFFGNKLPIAGLLFTEAQIAAYTAAEQAACSDGMVIAMGGGFDTEENFRPLIDTALRHVNKTAPRMLFIPTGHYDNLEENEAIPAWFANAGCETQTLQPSKATQAEIAEKIAWADIIYETGGNLQFLAGVWEETGVFGAVRAAFDRGAVLMGVSTGAMCWAERGWDDFGEETLRPIGSFPFIGKAGAYEYQEAAGILPFCVCPHFDNLGWHTFAFEAIKLDIPAIGIENGAALVYAGGAYTVISDAATPLRTAYLFAPEHNVVMADIKTNGQLVSVIAGERR